MDGFYVQTLVKATDGSLLEAFSPALIAGRATLCGFATFRIRPSWPDVCSQRACPGIQAREGYAELGGRVQRSCMGCLA